MNFMEPIDAAAIIRSYAGPVFGYALKRTRQREEAEDLAQDIMLQLLKSVSSGAQIRNVDAYVWTVAKYTWVHWCRKRAQVTAPAELNGVPELLLADPAETPLERWIDTEARRMLRREIAFLSERHRRIVVAHYYDSMPLGQIARMLGISVNTVKWHLHDARKELRRGMDRMDQTGLLSVKPIRFAGMGHSGTPGQQGETTAFLGRPLAQNIVYAAYRKPMSVREIAMELSVPPAFLEEEVAHLAEYAFLDEVSPGKYVSHTVIWDRTQEQREAEHRRYRQCAAQIAEAHLDALLDVRRQVEESGVYTPDGDYSFLLWTLLPKNIEEQAWRHCPQGTRFDAVAPMRKDGGRYTAYATLDNRTVDGLSFDPREYDICGPMQRALNGSPLYLWQMNTYWSDRPNWRHLHFEDVQTCGAFWNGELSDGEANREQYAFLLSKEYIRTTDSGYRFNAVWVGSPETLARLNAAMPDLTDVYAPAIASLYEDMLALAMRSQPKRLEPQIAHLVKGNTCGGVLTAYILKHLVDAGRLPEPLPHQRKTITTWMGPVKQK